jgi:hypothetical protein
MSAKQKEIIVDFRKQQREHPPIHRRDSSGEGFVFLGLHITNMNERKIKHYII